MDDRLFPEITSYLRTHAISNDFKFTTIVYSKGLLFLSDKTMIIIGHGNFDVYDQQFFIGDYSASQIQKLAEDKDTVALLACYSQMIALSGKQLLAYDNEIDLITAMDDLLELLQWEKKIRLFAM